MHTLKPFTVPEMTFKVTEGHWQCHTSLRRLHFLLETRRVGCIYFQLR